MGFTRKSLTDEYFINADPRVQMELLRTALSNRFGYSVDDSDPAFLIACSCLPPICQSLAKADLMIKQTLTQFATGSALEAIGADLGLERFTATAAQYHITITRDANETDDYPLSYSISGVFVNPYTNEELSEWSVSGTLDTVNSTRALTITADQGGYIPPYCVCRINQQVFTPNSNNGTTFGVSTDYWVTVGRDDETDDEFAERCYNTRTALRYYGSVKWYLTMLQNAGYKVADLVSMGTYNADGAAEYSILMYNDDFGEAPYQTSLERVQAVGYMATDLLIPGDKLSFVMPAKMGDGDDDAEITITVYRKAGDTATENEAQKAFDEWRAFGCNHFGMIDLASLSAYLRDNVPAISYLETSVAHLSQTSQPNGCIAPSQLTLTFADEWWV